MSDLINSVNFINLDIDRYLDWLKSEYKKLSIIHTLPSLDMEKRQLEKLQKGIINPRNEALADLNNQINDLKDLLPIVLFFDCAKYAKDVKVKDYGVFTANEIEQIRITDAFIYQCETLLNDWHKSFIENLNADSKKTPLPIKEFYANEHQKIRGLGIEYLENILNGQIIFNLNEYPICLDFFVQLSQIKELKYLEEKITLKKEVQKIISLNQKFSDSVNVVARLLYENSNKVFISTPNQWENLFSENIQQFTNPITLQPKVTLRDLSYFLDCFKQSESISKDNIYHLLEQAKVFSWKGSVVSKSQYWQANRKLESSDTKYKTQIDEIIKSLNIIDT